MSSSTRSEIDELLNKLAHFSLTTMHVHRADLLNVDDLSNNENTTIIQSNDIDNSKRKEEDGLDMKQKTTSATNNTTNIHRLITSHYSDPFFWCFYLIKNGPFKYELDSQTCCSSIIKSKEKLAITEMIVNVTKDHNNFLLLKKIGSLNKVRTNIMSDDAPIDLKTFVSLCVLDNINCVVIIGQKVFECCLHVNKPIHLIVHNGNVLGEKNEYFVILDCDKSVLLQYCTKLLKMPNYDLCLRAISAYKLSELIEMCRHLDIHIPLKMKKIDVYHTLVEALK